MLQESHLHDVLWLAVTVMSARRALGMLAVAVAGVLTGPQQVLQAFLQVFEGMLDAVLHVVERAVPRVVGTMRALVGTMRAIVHLRFPDMQQSKTTIADACRSAEGQSKVGGRWCVP